MKRILHCSLLLLVLMGLSVMAMPAAAAPCNPASGTAADEIFFCPGADGVDVGSGSDVVFVTGPVTNTIESGGGVLSIFVQAGGSINTGAGNGIFMNGSGDVVVTGDVTGLNSGVVVATTGDILSIGNVTGTNNFGLLIGDNGPLTSGGDILSIGNVSGGWYGIGIQGNGNVVSVGDVSGTTFNAIQIDGNGNITSVGTATGGQGGLVIAGNGNIASVGNVTGTAITGIQINGNGNVDSVGNVTGGLYGIYIIGTGDVNSNGIVNGGEFGIRLGTGGDVISDGTVTGGFYGIYTPTGHVINRGNVTGSSFNGIQVQGNGSVTNSGTVFGLQYGIGLVGNGNVINTGDVTGGSVNGIQIEGNGNLTSTGMITGGQSAIYVDGDSVIQVSGLVKGGSYGGIITGNGDQLIVIDALVNAGTTLSVETRGGNDRVNLTSNAMLQGDVLLGTGDDTFQIGSGSQVGGTIDGGADTDTLIVGDETVCRDDDDGRYNSVGALVRGINLSGDTFVFDGNSYTITDFENGENGIQRRTCTPPVAKIDDGRINPYDIGAWVAGYCNTQDGVNLWPIDLEGRGQVDISVSGAQMREALRQAVDSGENVLIASGPRGTSLWALPSNQYQFMRADQRESWKNYVYIFAPGTCGMGNSLGS